MDSRWLEGFRQDIIFGLVGSVEAGTGDYSPRLVLNEYGSTVEHAIVDELNRCKDFTFSVAFISSGAIAQIKQHLLDFGGEGRIITSDFLGFNSPRAYEELLNLRRLLGMDVRIHKSEAFHPKGYIFSQQRGTTAIIGSANLTNSALSRNHEWNLRVSAAHGSELAKQLDRVVEEQIASSIPLTQAWIEDYASSRAELSWKLPTKSRDLDAPHANPTIEPNEMQRDALGALQDVRAQGAKRAIIISATGTGKTMLSALDVRLVDPERLLFIVHREQIIDRTIVEYQRVLGGPDSNYGKLTGTQKNLEAKYLFSTIQTLSQDSVLAQLEADRFDYVIVDEAHRSAAETYRRVMNHFNPRFLLGMTATPERTDGFNVYELFDYNVPYEIRLNHALEVGLLCPFHYYGIADVTYEDGSTTTDVTEIGQLVTPERVDHLVAALDRYGQAGVAPRGLIFCSRKEEAQALAVALNLQNLRGSRLRTVALTGDDSIEIRESRVEDLENGIFDYIITVDVFNEGVDIPSINQVIMLRQTQSAIIFVQQLGRGLRLSEEKDHLVVLDVIGNYTNNYLIPVALFGDESLNRESLRERLNETAEAGALPGLSSVSFDEISRERIMRSIAQTRLDSMSNLKAALLAMQNRVGGAPALWDFLRFESVDPVLLATKKEHYPALLAALLKIDIGLTDLQSRALALLSHEVLGGKRLHEFVLLDLLHKKVNVTRKDLDDAFRERELTSSAIEVQSAIDTLALQGYPQSAQKRYRDPIVVEINGMITFTDEFRMSLESSMPFRDAVRDLLLTGERLTTLRYQSSQPFTPGMQYTRTDAAHLLGWPRAFASTIYGVKTDEELGVCAIFVTLEKSDDVAKSTAYQDQLLDLSTMRWFTKSRRNLSSPDVQPIVQGHVALHVFVKKDDAEGGDHYYLGQATSQDAIETTMPGDAGEELPVVSMLLRFDSAIRQGLFDYFASS